MIVVCVCFPVCCLLLMCCVLCGLLFVVSWSLRIVRRALFAVCGLSVVCYLLFVVLLLLSRVGVF